MSKLDPYELLERRAKGPTTITVSDRTVSYSWCGTCGKDKPDDGHSDCESCRKWWEENKPPVSTHCFS